MSIKKIKFTDIPIGPWDMDSIEKKVIPHEIKHMERIMYDTNPGIYDKYLKRYGNSK